MNLHRKFTPIKLLMVSLYLLISASCANDNVATPLLPDLGIPDNSLNRDLRVTAPSIWNKFEKNENSITLEITLITDKQVVTDPDFNAEIYMYDDLGMKWKRIENLGNYKIPPNEIILHQGNVKIIPLSEHNEITFGLV